MLIMYHIMHRWFFRHLLHNVKIEKGCFFATKMFWGRLDVCKRKKNHKQLAFYSDLAMFR